MKENPKIKFNRLFSVAQQIGPTTRAVEIIIKNQLEVLKTKFNSFSALDAKERQLQRGLKEVRRSKMKHSIRVSRHQSKPVAQEPEEVRICYFHVLAMSWPFQLEFIYF